MIQHSWWISFIQPCNIHNFSKIFKLFQNISKFRNFSKLKIWYRWYLFCQIGSRIAQDVYNKVNITFCFVQYNFYCTLENWYCTWLHLVQYHFSLYNKNDMHSTKCSITIIFQTVNLEVFFFSLTAFRWRLTNIPLVSQLSNMTFTLAIAFYSLSDIPQKVVYSNSRWNCPEIPRN